MARNVKFTVRLEAEERRQLLDLVTKGKRAAATLTRARILLKADAGSEGPAWDDNAIAEAVETSLSTVHRVRQDFVEEGMEEALFRKKPTGRPRGSWQASPWFVLPGPTPAVSNR